MRTNVLELLDVKRERGADLPDVSLVFVAMRRNVHELPDMVRLTADWGVGRLRVQNLSHDFSDTEPGGNYAAIRHFTAAEALYARPGDDVERVFRSARQVARERGVALRLPRVEQPPPRRHGAPGCDWPWRSAYVTHDGQVQPCCMLMGSDRGVLGDVARSDLPSVWRGEAYAAFRAALLGDRPPDVRRGCAMYRGVF